MTDIVIDRTYLPLATTGSMSVLDRHYCTIEPPKDGPISCVPEGTYVMEPYLSPTHGPTWTLRNEALGIVGQDEAGPGEHNFVEVHTGNWSEDSRKCVIIGMQDHPMTNPKTGHFEPAVENSKTAMGQFLALLGPMSTGHTLKIQSGQGF